MKIGVLAHHLDTRKDLRDLLNLLSRNHDVVAYIQESEAPKIKQIIASHNHNSNSCIERNYQNFSVDIWQYTLSRVWQTSSK